MLSFTIFHYLKKLIPGPFSNLPLPKTPKQEFCLEFLSAAVTFKKLKNSMHQFVIKLTELFLDYFCQKTPAL